MSQELLYQVFSRGLSIETDQRLIGHWLLRTIPTRIYSAFRQMAYGWGGSATNSSTAQREALIYNGTTEIYPGPGTSAIISGLSNDGRYSSGIYYSGPYSFFYDKTTASLTTLDVTSGYPYTIHATGISRYGNAVVGEMEVDVNTYVMFRWTPSGGYENLGKIPETSDGSGQVANAQFPKIGGCSALGTTVAVTQFNVSTTTPAFWTPD